MARTRLYRHGVLAAEDFPVDDVSEHLAEPDTTVWLDFCAPTEDDLAAIIEELGLHELAVEGALQRDERAKVERCDGYSTVTAYSVSLDENGELVDCELSAFVTEQALVTVRKNEDFDIESVVSRWDADADQAKSGVGFLLHGLLDYIVDGHFEAAQRMDEQIEELEDGVFDERPQHQQLQRRSLQLRKNLVRLRRAVLPMREVVNTLMRHDSGLVDEVMAPYFQDVYDHVLRASEWTESLRDLITTIRETQLNLQSFQLNMIMKKVTGWAAIIAVPTAITGFYGQNVPYPGFQSAWGFWASTAAILVISGALFATFRRKDWL